MSDTGTFTSNAGIGLGAVLGILGVVAYAATDFASATALIPSVLGFVIVVLGVVGREFPQRQPIAIYGMGAIAVLGVLGSMMGVPDIVELVTGGDPDSTVAPISQGVTILVSLVLVGLVASYAAETRR